MPRPIDDGAANPLVLGFSVVHQQMFHLIEIGAGSVASPREIPGGILDKSFGHPVEQILAPILEEPHQHLLDQLVDSLAPQGVLHRFCNGALHQFLDEQSLHLVAAREAPHGVAGTVHLGASPRCAPPRPVPSAGSSESLNSQSGWRRCQPF